MSEYTVASYLAETMYRTGTGRVYGIIGTSVLDLLDAIYDYRGKLHYISTRHEQVAASAADAEARLTGRPGYAIVHAGPGFLNAVISLGIAYRDRSPLILVSGGVKRRLYRTGAWLEVDQQAIADPITVDHARLSTPEELPAVIRRLLRASLRPPTGPAHLEVPEDLWNTRLPSSTPPPPTIEELLQPPREPSSEDIREAVELAREAEQPLILLCREAARSGAWNTVERLSTILDAPIVYTGNARGFCDETSPKCLGRVGFGGGSLPADKALEEADLLIVLGGELDDITTYAYTLMPRGEVVIASEDPLAWKRPILPSLEVHANPLLFAEKLAIDLEREDVRRTNSGWMARLEEYRRVWQSMLSEAVERRYTGRVNPNRFFHELNEKLPGDAIITAGQGTHIVYTYNYLKLKPPARFLAATNLGAMGFALPAAIGAALAYPERTVLAVVGDGELMMTVQDLETIARARAPVKIILVNDDSYRVLLLRQNIQKKGRIIGTLHSNPDYTLLAQSMGIEAETITRDEEIPHAIERLLEPGKPYLLEIKIPREDLPPLNLEMTLKMS